MVCDIKLDGYPDNHHIWVSSNGGSPVVTIGFNAKSWSNDLDDLVLHP